MRGTTAKGDYSNFSQPGYLDEKNAGQQGGWLNGISSLLQIIAVKVPFRLFPSFLSVIYLVDYRLRGIYDS